MSSKTCGALGCTDAAVGTIDHPRIGSLVVCQLHAGRHEITEVVDNV